MDNLTFDSDFLQETYSPDFAMAYWSWVFKQDWYLEKDKPMVDFVFWVENTKDWHIMNLEKNSWDYSMLVKVLWIQFINFLQTTGAKIYYNPYIDFDNISIKYWVISKSDLIDDLNNWVNLYVSWRLHKPVKIICSDPEIDIALKKNLEHALNVALQLLPEKFSYHELFKTIAGLSYLWDSRMKFWENPKKVENIVNNNFDSFLQLYSDILEARNNIFLTLWWNLIIQDKSYCALKFWYSNLPKNLQEKVDFFGNIKFLQEEIRRWIHSIVNWTSKVQTIKGFFTSWPVKSLKYATEKLKKWKKK